jgi:hypothetical protein
MDLLKKFLNSESVSSPTVFSQTEATKHEKELTALLKLGIVKKRAVLTFPCGNCGTYCEIKQSGGGEYFILCDSCEDARLETLNADQRIEYVFSLTDLLSIFLKDLGYPIDRINQLFQNRLWSLGTHDINDTQREILFVRNPNDAEMDVFQVLQQKQPFHPLVFSTISQGHPLGISFTIVPLENLLATRGKNIFSKQRFEKLLEVGGKPMSDKGIAFGKSGIVLEETELLHNKDSFGNYQREKLEPLQRNLLENLHRRGQTNKNKWYSRNELATAFGVQEKSISNAMTDIRKIATKISTILIEQHAKNKNYRINPDLL